MARDDPETLWPIVVRMVAEAPNERHLVTVVPLRWSGAKAAAAVRPGANNGLSPLTTGKSGFEIVGIDVRQGSLPRTACDMGPCPPAVAHLLEQIAYVDIVALHYQYGRLPARPTTGSVEVQVTRYRDGREVLGPVHRLAELIGEDQAGQPKRP
jgi:hypothetical protein